MKLTRLFSLSLILLMCPFAGLHAQTPEGGDAFTTGTVNLPTESVTSDYERLIRDAQQRGNVSPRFAEFRSVHGAWNAFWDEWTGTPYRLFGEGIATGESVTEDNVERISRRVIAECRSLLGCPDDQIAFVSANEYDGKWNVLFTQRYKGLPVLFSDVIVRLTSEGRVPMLGSEYYSDITVSTTPSMTRTDAQAAALKGLDLTNVAPLEFEHQGLCILPVRSLAGVSFHLAWQMVVSVDPTHIWNTWVDAHSGRVLWRWNQVRDGIDGTVTGSVRVSSVQDAPTTNLMPDLTVKVNGNSVTTDAAGYFSTTYSGTVTASLTGPYVKVMRQNGTNASITMTVPSGGTALINWTNSNSLAEERSAFYHVARAHRYIKTLDNGCTAMDYQVQAKVNVTGVCNAFWDGTNLNFYQSGTVSGSGTCPNMAELPDVIFHEYGHGINDKFYKQLGKTSGMTNTALHEGLADANSAMILDRSQMGVGFWGAGTILRDNNNTRKYPDDITGESHNDGEILAGAIWEMRKSLPLSVCEHLVHYAKRGLPDDSNTGKAYVKYFIEVLEADDNDGNLANGTPNSAQIVPAFALHGIPSGMFTITHTAVDAAAAGAAIPLTATVVSPMAPLATSLVRIHHRTGATGTWYTTDMSKVSGTVTATSNWSGSIPGQQAGQIIDYYIEVTESFGSSITYPSRGAAAPFRILVGFTTHILYNFETAAGWAADQGDDASTGKWINATPIGSYVSTAPVQTNADHSATGTKCWVTANATAGADPGTADVDDGTTTLNSPVFSLAGLNEPVIRYYAWYTNNMGASPSTDYFIVQISNDGGGSWTDIYNSMESFTEWRGFIVPVSTFVTPTATMRLRFIASDADPQSLVEAAVDDVEILYAQSLPVELSSLSASRTGREVSVSWTTESEVNNAGFDVEYRIDGTGDWQRAGFVPGHATTTERSHYHFTFGEAGGLALQIRLKQMDIDGSITHSPVVLVQAMARRFELTGNHPNPFSGTTTVEFTLPSEGSVRIHVRNVLGQTVLVRESAHMETGVHAIPLDLHGLPSGMYTCEVEALGTRAFHTMTLR